MKNEIREKRPWDVVTDCGAVRTWAVTRARAVRNARYRLVMESRPYRQPRPQDLAEMREIGIIDVRQSDGEMQGKPRERQTVKPQMERMGRR